MQNPYETVALLKERKEEREKIDQVLPDLAKINIQEQLLVPQPADESLYREMMHLTPARIGVWRTGTRPLTRTMLRFRADHALAQDSVLGMVPEEFASAHGLLPIQTQVENKEQYLTRPDLGRKLSLEARETLTKGGTAACQVQVVVADGLSSKAIGANIPDLLPALMQGLAHYGFIIGRPIFVKYGRVACMDEIGEILHPESLVILIGERPGLGTAESLSAYMAYKPHRSMLESERSVISNIHRGGIPPLEAGAHLASLMKQILASKASGVRY
ncbi:ethanolamine ammonia-lyase subunit EutC [Desulfosporosinus sp. FKB]|uniref:ethanolamine ammonia-lyase subunit EutC n=1 Tax=Desulfosporosinus sp. FKB TaxID=1969835 RepID=UPI000B49EF0B|nr:ethanolamine ammonia-lyase subunit EutC [Desulfosporosinus sp. FKB]